ncbi:MAG: folate-binding protein [Pseudomonadota bacterium]
MTEGFWAKDRQVIALTGDDAVPFLQNLVTNDVSNVPQGGCAYTALLSPKGKYLFDFFVVRTEAGFLLDAKADRAAALAQRLNMYRLRAALDIKVSDLQVVQGFGEPPREAAIDPRREDLGWRAWVADPETFLGSMPRLDPQRWEEKRIASTVPETGAELLPDDAFILEMGFDRLNGVDFKKGCYIGQEVTARMKHKTELRKGLITVRVDGDPPACGTPILSDGKPAGTLFSTANGLGLAHLRYDRMDGELVSGDASIHSL